ncbi:MAG: hypothetical protein ABI863_04820 [Ginsengibacter sp.]
MQHLRLCSPIILSAYLFYACSGNSSATAGKDSASNTTSGNSGGTTYSGNSCLAYTINGKHTAIKEFMHNGDGKNRMALFLNKVKNNPATGMVKANITNELTKEVFNFSIANSGGTTILHYNPSLSNFADKKSSAATYMLPKYKNYYGNPVIVNITDINATHVAGTFADKFLSADDKPVSL